MKRIPEQDLMDTVEQAQAYAETDFSEAHDAFVSHFSTRFPDFSAGEVLDLGCGTADVLIRFARAFPSAGITGIDGARAMLDIAGRDILENGLSNQIRLMQCLLPDTALSSTRYDAIISNSLLHHLHDPMVLWDTVQQCSRPGGPVFIMDLMRPETTDRARELVQLHARDASPILQSDFFNSLLASYREEEIQDQLRSAGLSYLEAEIISDRHILLWGTRR